MRGKIFGLLAAGIFTTGSSIGCAPAGGAASPRADVVRIPLSVRTITLKNGLKVILDEDHRSPTVAVDVNFDVGSRDDPKGRSGLAHFVEHIGFLGTRHTHKGDQFKLLAEVGATNVNATTSSDRTHYFETVPSDALDLALWLESDRMGFFAEGVDESAFENERRVVKNEHRQSVDDRDEGLVTMLERERLFPEGHPYHRSTIGQLTELDDATFDDAKAFHAKYYVPSNATVVLVGDFDPARALASVQKYFGTLPKGNPAPPVPKATATLHGEKRVIVEASVDWPSVHVAWAMPPAGDPNEPAIRVALQGICNFVAYWQIFEHKTARESSCWYDAEQLGSVAQIGFTLNSEKSFDAVVAAIDTAINDTPNNRFAGVTTAVARYSTEQMFKFEGFSDRAERYGFFDQVSHNPLFLGPLLRRYAALNRADATEARQRYFPVENRVITFVKAVPTAPVAGRIVSDQ
jgi:predicted Zn-dependent peptidase